MRALDLESAFRRHLDSNDRALAELDATTSIDSMIGFYTDHRVADVVIQHDGDMLLFQWGPSIDQRDFVYDITRQVIIDHEGDDDIRQLSLTLHYPAAPDIGRGNLWCPRPEEAEAFRSSVARHPATAHVLTRRPHRVQLTFDHAG